jgi:hypothetical protein
MTKARCDRAVGVHSWSPQAELKTIPSSFEKNAAAKPGHKMEKGLRIAA